MIDLISLAIEHGGQFTFRRHRKDVSGPVKWETKSVEGREGRDGGKSVSMSKAVLYRHPKGTGKTT
jgi:hypothetical protein